MSLHLANQGTELLILGRNPEKTEALVKEIENNGGKAKAYTCDVMDWESVETAVKEIEGEHDSLDILINAAGGNMPGAVVTPDQNFLDLDLPSLRKVMDLNYLGTVLPIKALLPLMLKKKQRQHIEYQLHGRFSTDDSCHGLCFCEGCN